MNFELVIVKNSCQNAIEERINEKDREQSIQKGGGRKILNFTNTFY